MEEKEEVVKVEAEMVEGKWERTEEKRRMRRRRGGANTKVETVMKKEKEIRKELLI